MIWYALAALAGLVLVLGIIVANLNEKIIRLNNDVDARFRRHDGIIDLISDHFGRHRSRFSVFVATNTRDLKSFKAFQNRQYAEFSKKFEDIYSRIDKIEGDQK